MKNPFHFLAEVFAGMDEMHDDEMAWMVEAIGNSILRLPGREVKRIEHMERSRKTFACKWVSFEYSARVKDGILHGFRKSFCFFTRRRGDVDAIAFLHLADALNRFILSPFGFLEASGNNHHRVLIEQEFQRFEFGTRQNTAEHSHPPRPRSVKQGE